MTQITLIGHTDSTGSHAVNDKISEQRAISVKKYLQELGINSQIITFGKGKREPLQLANLPLYTPTEINALNRRVELMAH
jgi:OOP family OmpA-OmpF porin